MEVKEQLNLLKQKYTFCFSARSGYKPIMKAIYLKKNL